MFAVDGFVPLLLFAGEIGRSVPGKYNFNSINDEYLLKEEKYGLYINTIIAEYFHVRIVSARAYG